MRNTDRSLVTVALAAGWIFLTGIGGHAPLLLGGEPQRPITLGSVKGPDGRTVEISPPADGVTVLLFYSPECPISNAYSQTLTDLSRTFPAPRTRWVGICVDPDLSPADLTAHAKDFGLSFPIVLDPQATLAKKLGATMTPEAFVVDARGLLRYHGRIDDQFAARGVRNANPAGTDLKDAIAAVLAGREVKTPHVPAVGCPISQPKPAASTPTYTREVSRLIQRHCLECHRSGQVGPFALETFEQARKRAEDIASIVEDRTMPPWKAARGVGQPIKHDRSLSDQDLAVLRSWADAGAPEGVASDLPPPRTFPHDWTMEGGPDLVLDIGVDFEVPANGRDIYRCFVVPTNLPKDMYVSAIEYQPGNRKVVHHVLTYVDTDGEARKKDAADPGPGYECFSGPGIEIHGDLGGWAPGNQPTELPEGIGRSFPKGGDVVIQVHYHPSGKTETDRTRIGLRFARNPVRQILHWNAALNTEMKLPAGESNTEIKASWTVPVDVVAHGVVPHMHLLGKDMLMSVNFPDGRAEDLIRVDNWDFNWQYSYYFQNPIELPKGSVVKVVAHFDNSSDNPRNPNREHPKDVTWGEATTDEMCIGFIAVTKKGQDLTKPGEKDDLLDIFRAQQEESRRDQPKPERKRKRSPRPGQ